MGVQNLWQLLDSAGKPVPLETLQGQILAIDVSIWIHQANHGITGRNGHIQLLFSRVCKLLFFGIKPVFVFDGPTPLIKKTCLEQRRKRRATALANSADLRKAVITKYLKSHILAATDGLNSEAENLLPKVRKLPAALTQLNSFDELFRLDDDLNLTKVNNDVTETETSGLESNDEESEQEQLLNIDIDSAEFKALKYEAQHEILMSIRELKKRKCTLGSVPTPNSMSDFSSFQLSNFLERSMITRRIEDVRKDMNKEGLALLGLANVDGAIVRKVASEDSTYMVYVKDLPKSQRSKVNEMIASHQNVDQSNSSFNIMDQPTTSSYENIEKSNSSSRLLPIGIEKSENTKVMSDLNENERNVSVGKTQLQKDLMSDFIVELQNDVKDNQAKSDIVEDILDDATKPDESKDSNASSQVSDSEVTENNFPAKLSCSENVPDDIKGQSEVSDSKVGKNLGAVFVESQKQFLGSELKSVIRERMDEEKTLVADFEEEKDAESCQRSSTVLEVQNGGPEEYTRIPHNQERVINMKNDNDVIGSSDDDFEDVPKLVNGEHMQASSSHHCLSNDAPSTSKVRFTDPETDSQDDVVASWSKEVDNDASKLQEIASDWLQTENIDQLESETVDLIRELEREDSRATTITQLMYEQCQQLLKLFGVPYIISPGEAEAQCAFLDSSGLVNGCVTDDSDVWLFGGKVVYKNFFERNKFVEQFKMASIENSLRINRSNLICLAMMLGSDYCDGIENIGPVHGMEVLEEFGREFGIGPLEKFRKWHRIMSNQIVPQASNAVRKRLIKFKLPTDFPSQEVFDAYYNPKVDESRERFKWGSPDVYGLREFMGTHMGWSTQKLNEILDPVLEKQRKFAASQQMTLDQFYQERLGTAKRSIKSKRINCAIDRMKQDDSSELKRSKNQIPAKAQSTSKDVCSSSGSYEKPENDADSFFTTFAFFWND